MDSINFVVDLIVTNFDSPDIEDFSSMQIVAKFGGTKIILPADCINVSDFKTGAGVDIAAPSAKLRKNLEDNGVTMVVSYRSKTIGAGQIAVPQDIIDMIEAGMSDLLYVDTCTIEKEGVYVGKAEVLCRIVIKCDDLEMEEERIECVRNVEKAINKQDILFVLGKPQECARVCDPCQEVLEPDEGDERLNLDLGRYRSSATKAQRVTAATTTSVPIGSNACCQLKQMTKECEKMINSLTSRFGKPKAVTSLCWGPDGKDLGGTCSPINQYYQDSAMPSDLRGPCFSYIPAREGYSPDFCDPTLIPAQISDINKPFIKPPRFCPICLTNMSWLPRLADCPRCGAKAMPVIEARHREKKLTSEQIILEVLGEPKLDSEMCEDPCQKAERERRERSEGKDGSFGGGSNKKCECKGGQFCAHCRIRQLCAGIFKAAKNEVECPNATPSASEDFCVKVTDPQECTTHLTHVFSELRDLYRMKDMQRREYCGHKPAKKRPLRKNNSKH
ncbi:hypothetical protein AWZ03_013303 [Drosophila navojoa]|uniref:Uncharacterized protein n=1 Tax=Drosophila navojoa TaxID=7232 RepID=A0A484AV69_DRONA|nr:uncharacterized protein LOC115564774 [Drosophila navojoa]TDG40273.1 hypothetical protein AWZ03_013303 [Drosophila navojoa]